MFDAFSAVRLAPDAAGKVAGNLASGTVPDPRFDAFKLVIFEPLIAAAVPVKLAAGILVRFAADAAGSVAGNLASGIVPEPRFDALRLVRLAPDTAAIVPVI